MMLRFSLTTSLVMTLAACAPQAAEKAPNAVAVSYTHLTLPTILRV